LCGPLEDGASYFSPLKPAVIRTDRAVFEAADFSLLSVTVEGIYCRSNGGWADGGLEA